VCLKGTLFTPLSKKNTSTQSLNVQMRKDLELTVNLVHGFTLPGIPVRHEDLDIVVIRWVICHMTRYMCVTCDVASVAATCAYEVNLVHGFTLPGIPVRHEDLDIVVIRCVTLCYFVTCSCILNQDLELTVNLVHGFTLPGIPVRHEDLDIVVIRCVTLCYFVTCSCILNQDLELTVNLVHGFTLPGIPVRHEDLDIVVIRWVSCYLVHVTYLLRLLCGNPVSATVHLR
jgi:hypothetical protein